VERLAYPDGAGESAWVSVSAAVRVVDVRRATEHCSDHVKEAMAMIRDVLRRTLSSRRASEVRRNRHGCEQELNTQLASELEKIGVALSGLEITEVSAPGTERSIGSAGVH